MSWGDLSEQNIFIGHQWPTGNHFLRAYGVFGPELGENGVFWSSKGHTRLYDPNPIIKPSSEYYLWLIGPKMAVIHQILKVWWSSEFWNASDDVIPKEGYIQQSSNFIGKNFLYRSFCSWLSRKHNLVSLTQTWSNNCNYWMICSRTMLIIGFGTFTCFFPERLSSTLSVSAIFPRYVIEEALISMYFSVPWTKKMRKFFGHQKLAMNRWPPSQFTARKGVCWSGFGHHSFNNWSNAFN